MSKLLSIISRKKRDDKSLGAEMRKINLKYNKTIVWKCSINKAKPVKIESRMLFLLYARRYPHSIIILENDKELIAEVYL